jgi:ribosomal-protein-alanine acetyltransferase
MSEIHPARDEELIRIARIETARFEDPWSYPEIKEQAGTEGFFYLVSADGDEVEGYIGFLVSGDSADIYSLAVKKECEGKGIGGKLLEKALEFGKEKGVKTFFLEVRPSNTRALTLYIGHGFGEYRRRKQYYSDGEDALLLKKEISS